MLDSYDKYARKYLLENSNTQIKQATLLIYLRTVTTIDQINIDMMRSMYITHEYNKGISYKDKELLSLKRRNSAETSSNTYYNILDKQMP